MNPTPTATREAVLCLVNDGWTSERIAEAMRISKRTVERIRSDARRTAEDIRADAGELRAMLSEAG